MTSTIANVEQANAALHSLQQLTTSIREAVADPGLQKEQDYITRVSPQLDEATRTYQGLAAFLQEHKNDKASRGVQRSFVKAMQELQQAQRNGARRREALCDSDFLAVSKISSEDIQRAKEEVLAAGQVAREAVVVKELFRQVGAIVADQSKGVEQIEAKVETIRVEIGRGVNELEHAHQLQREARQKYMYILCLATLLVAAIVLPIALTLLN